MKLSFSEHGLRLRWLPLIVLLAMTGCEWEGVGDGDYWSERGMHINFSGTYRPTQGSSIILSYEPGGVVDAGSGVGTITGQQIAVGDGASTVYSGALSQKPVIAGSLSITAGGFSFTDDGNGNLSGDNASGNINYETGAWSIDLGGVPLNDGVEVVATYRYDAVAGGGEDASGSTHPIYQFHVQHFGNQVTLIDNYNQSYNGTLTSVDTVYDSGMPVVGQSQRRLETRHPFVAEGVSHGIPVRIVGTFNAEEISHFRRPDDEEDETEEYTVYSFRLQGTWIESSGKTGEIDAVGPEGRY